jgi:integrase
MDGVRRPRYFNERDRRLKGDEEERLLNAAFNEDAAKGIEARLEELMAEERTRSVEARSGYARKNIVKQARRRLTPAAKKSYKHIPWMEAFIQFQLMTGARRSETLSITWKDIDLAGQTAFIAETKNGRPRKLPLRKDLIVLLLELPHRDGPLFPMSVDALRKAWNRICNAAGLVGDDELRIHDLRHEAISRVAEAGAQLPDGFSLVDLQAFSGHRDTRMLLRYTHLCMPSFAKRLDQAFASCATLRHGRRRLQHGAKLTVAELVRATALPSPADAMQPPTLPDNVIMFPLREPA